LLRLTLYSLGYGHTSLPTTYELQLSESLVWVPPFISWTIYFFVLLWIRTISNSFWVLMSILIRFHSYLRNLTKLHFGQLPIKIIFTSSAFAMCIMNRFQSTYCEIMMHGSLTPAADAPIDLRPTSYWSNLLCNIIC
jgi:hypothetical protein